MQLQLAIVLSHNESGCLVQPLNSIENSKAKYSQPMIEYKISASAGDLVATTLYNGSVHIIFRWKRVEVLQIENDRIQVGDYHRQIYSLPLTPYFQKIVSVGGFVFTDNNAICDIIVRDVPSNPDRFHKLFFPRIREMYAQIFPRIREMYAQTGSVAELNPKEVVAQGYDEIAEKYLEWSMQVRREERARYTSLVLEKLPLNAKVLDLGCGAGLLTTKKLADCFQVVGVDISPRHIEMAQENVPNATFICADMAELDFSPASFDGIVAFYSLFHLPREEQNGLLQQVAEWLRPGGFFVATLGVNSVRGDIDEDWLGTTMYWSSYDQETNKQAIQATGLHILSANEETAEELDKLVTFLWIVAQKPQGVSS